MPLQWQDQATLSRWVYERGPEKHPLPVSGSAGRQISEPANRDDSTSDFEVAGVNQQMACYVPAELAHRQVLVSEEPIAIRANPSRDLLPVLWEKRTRLRKCLVVLGSRYKYLQGGTI
jgi:hypothetical protein